MKRIPTNDFTEYCRTLNGQEITTRAGRSRFVLNVIGADLEFVPVSSKKPRSHTKRYIDIVLDHFAETESFITSDYTTLTANSTYMLTLIDLYRRASAHESISHSEEETTEPSKKLPGACPVSPKFQEWNLRQINCVA